MAVPEIRMPKFTVSMLDTCKRYKRNVGHTLYEVMAHVDVGEGVVRLPTQATIAQFVKDCFDFEIEVQQPEIRYTYSFQVLIPARASLERRVVFLARVASAAMLVPRAKKRTA